MSPASLFKRRLSAREPMLGTFVKTPSPMICEVLGRADLDVICLDAEHSPFDRGDIDACLLACQRVGKPALVRVPSAHPEHILNALDCGATGILAPHVSSREAAEALVANGRYGKGRGYAGSTRAAGYGARTLAEHLSESANDVTLIAQLEDAAVLDELDRVLTTPGMDAFFIGRADLAVSLGATGLSEPVVISAVTDICRRGAAHGVIIGLFTADLTEISHWRSLGASLFLLSSDHSMMLTGAAALAASVRSQF